MKRMKPISGVVLLALVFSCQQKEKEGTLKVDGVVKNAGASMVYLEENTPNGRPVILDSSKLGADGAFSLEAGEKEESLFQLRLNGKTAPFALFINDAQKITVSADISNTKQPYTVQNSKASQELLAFDRTSYEKGMQLFTEGSKVDSLQKAAAPDSSIMTVYRKVETIANDLKAFTQDFLAKSSSPVLSLYVLSSFQNTASNLGIKGFSKVELAEAISAAAQKFPAHTALQSIKKSLPSSKAADFTQPDVAGNPVSLSQFRGKYVLVDFWASWCQPCRQDNPNVVKAYQQFKDKNFTVLGVSLDQNKNAWQKAIQQDGLTWTHVSDLKFWDNEAAKLYGVQGIPYNVLVDPDGNIVAENLHGDEIVQTLQKVIR